jgi:hypothetical protein
MFLVFSFHPDYLPEIIYFHKGQITNPSYKCGPVPDAGAPRVVFPRPALAVAYARLPACDVRLPVHATQRTSRRRRAAAAAGVRAPQAHPQGAEGALLWR